MSGSIQSSNYVPGVSGWKLNPGGDFEINSSKIAVGSLPSDPQPITITAGDWSDYDLPANAIERYAFIGAELAKIPAECRDSAEFTTEDISFDRDGSDYRTTLTYVRQETQEEVLARHEKAKAGGTRISIKDGLMTVTIDGVERIKIDNLDRPAPFKVDGDRVLLNKAFVNDGSVAKAKTGAGFYVHIPGVYVDADGRLHVAREDASSDEGRDSKLSANWSIKMQLHKGQYAAAGIGLGIGSQFLVSADKFRMGCMCFGGYTGHIPLKR